MKKNLISIVTIILAIISLIGCSNQTSTSNTSTKTMTNEEIISAVKNAYFEGYSQKTIGQYCKGYADAHVADEEWIIGTEEANNAILELVPSLDLKNEKTIKWSVTSVGIADSKTTSFFFSYNKNTKKVVPIMFMYESKNKGLLNGAIEKEDIKAAIDVLVEESNGL